MKKLSAWIVLLLAFSLALGSCATFDDAKASMKKSFPGRTDNTSK